MASAILTERLHIVRRRPCFTSVVDFPPPIRPSILDPMRGDLWIGVCQADSLTLFAGKQPLVAIAGTRVDWMALNTRLRALREGHPRRNRRR